MASMNIMSDFLSLSVNAIANKVIAIITNDFDYNENVCKYVCEQTTRTRTVGVG